MELILILVVAYAILRPINFRRIIDIIGDKR